LFFDLKGRSQNTIGCERGGGLGRGSEKKGGGGMTLHFND
jgi:hypothetical protein